MEAGGKALRCLRYRNWTASQLQQPHHPQRTFLITRKGVLHPSTLPGMILTFWQFTHGSGSRRTVRQSLAAARCPPAAAAAANRQVDTPSPPLACCIASRFRCAATRRSGTGTGTLLRPDASRCISPRRPCCCCGCCCCRCCCWGTYLRRGWWWWRCWGKHIPSRKPQLRPQQSCAQPTLRTGRGREGGRRQRRRVPSCLRCSKKMSSPGFCRWTASSHGRQRHQDAPALHLPTCPHTHTKQQTTLNIITHTNEIQKTAHPGFL